MCFFYKWRLLFIRQQDLHPVKKSRYFADVEKITQCIFSIQSIGGGIFLKRSRNGSQPDWIELYIPTKKARRCGGPFLF